MTRTYVVMDISDAAYIEIKAAMIAAGYQHAFDGDGNIDMHGIAVNRAPASTSAPAADTWVHDPSAAAQYSRTHTRAKSVPPHWIRCEFVRNGIRCYKGEGHEKGVGTAAEHAEPKV